MQTRRITFISRIKRSFEHFQSTGTHQNLSRLSRPTGIMPIRSIGHMGGSRVGTGKPDQASIGIIIMTIAILPHPLVGESLDHHGSF